MKNGQSRDTGKAWTFCSVEDNKIISCFRKYICGTGVKKKRIFNILSVVRGCRPGDNLLSLSMLYMFVLLTGLSPLSQSKKFQALPVSLDCPFFIASSIFSTVYLNILEQFRYNKTYIAFISDEHQVVAIWFNLQTMYKSIRVFWSSVISTKANLNR
jgi:hypothetical protein